MFFSFFPYRNRSKGSAKRFVRCQDSSTKHSCMYSVDEHDSRGPRLPLICYRTARDGQSVSGKRHRKIYTYIYILMWNRRTPGKAIIDSTLRRGTTNTCWGETENHRYFKRYISMRRRTVDVFLISQNPSNRGRYISSLNTRVRHLKDLPVAPFAVLRAKRPCLCLVLRRRNVSDYRAPPPRLVVVIFSDGRKATSFAFLL